jgi:hypothetical protein
MLALLIPVEELEHPTPLAGPAGATSTVIFQITPAPKRAAAMMYGVTWGRHQPGEKRCGRGTPSKTRAILPPACRSMSSDGPSHRLMTIDGAGRVMAMASTVATSFSPKPDEAHDRCSQRLGMVSPTMTQDVEHVLARR